MSIKLKKLLRKAVYKTKGFSFALLWIDIRYGVEEWILLKTANWRLKRTKRLKLSSMAYHSDQMTWDDVDVSDQWGFWLPLGFGICSKKSWEFDNQINRDIGQPEEPWQDVSGGDSWKTYYFKEDFLNSNHYFQAARKHLKDKLGDKVYEKEFEVSLFTQSQKSLDDDIKQQIDWIAAGSPKMKIQFTDQAKEDFKRILGDEAAQDLFDKYDETKPDEEK